ncbi:MAG: hypothetical protein P8N76_12830 [Pirellulaceae bacterium]|nr:hypothetical protein [Pirellulaceae bacterium]
MISNRADLISNRNGRVDLFTFDQRSEQQETVVSSFRWQTQLSLPVVTPSTDSLTFVPGFADSADPASDARSDCLVGQSTMLVGDRATE